MSTTKRARKRAPPPSDTSSGSSDPEASDMEELLFHARTRLSFLAKSLAQFRTELALRTTSRARRADLRTQQRAELDLQEREDLRQAREEQRHIEVQEEGLADLGKLFRESEKMAEAKTALRHAARSRRKSSGPAHKRRAFDPDMSEVESVSIKISASQQEAREARAEGSAASRMLSGDTARTISNPTPSRTSFDLPEDPFSTPIRPQHLPALSSGSTTRDPSPPPPDELPTIASSHDHAAFNPLSDLPSLHHHLTTPTAPRDLTPPDRPTARHPRKAAPKNLSEVRLMSAQITPSQIGEEAALPELTELFPERRKAGRPRGSKNKVPGRRGGRGARGGLGRGGGGFGYSSSGNGVSENAGGVGGNDGGDVGSGVDGVGDNGGEGSAAMGAAAEEAEVEITEERVKDESVGVEMPWTPGSTFRPKEEVRFMTERKVKQPTLNPGMWAKAMRRKSEPN